MQFSCVIVALALAGCSGNVIDTGGADGGGGSDGGGGPDARAVDAAPVVGEDPSVMGIVAAHNAVRASVMPVPSTPLPALTWSASAFSTARAWAANCQFAHNAARGNLGENIYATGGTSTAQQVVASWASESANYNYAANSCSGTCGHYTQVVWRTTTSIGCAAQLCTTGSPFGSGSWQLWVCDYSPPGNSGGRPY